MKSFYRLLQHEFQLLLRPVLVLICLAILVPLPLLRGVTKGFTPYAPKMRYEELFASSGAETMFFVMVILLFASFAVVFYGSYWRSKSIYTYLSLPVRREYLYIAKLLAFAICILLLIAAELIGIRWGYSYAIGRLETESGNALMHNGLFLAFVRSDFFRFLFPVSFSRIFSSFSLILSAATGTYYAVLCERSRRFFGLGAVAAALYLILRVASYRLNETVLYYTAKSLYPSSILLLLLGGFFVWHSIVLYKKGAIA
ncbi:hypothetical protein [Gorillibacterium massiliense]|uniref:hypothetical protein n=1 Tax=Gorillibacterium massiliense TaxID=1280390 RepID=UPI0004B0AEE6|nr:hypothetical protein [Gorillibacterium massiliense]